MTETKVKRRRRNTAQAPQRTSNAQPNTAASATAPRRAAGRIVYQGEPGANSHIACRDQFPEMEAVGCATFEDALNSVRRGDTSCAMIPIENSVAGRVADVHHLLPDSGLQIIGEHFERISHQLLALPGARIDDLRTVHSHIQALGQCRQVIQSLGLEPVTQADTAGAARMIARAGDITQAAIASELAAEVHDLQIMRRDIQDASHNTTRFLVLAREPVSVPAGNGPVITTFVFRVRNVPAALYKALGGFATNGVNMTKLESYQLEGSFHATMFYADIEGHPDERRVQLALEELHFFSSKVTFLGTYPASPLRETLAEEANGRLNEAD
ncbi:prephenate dehydratase [Dichotomicrobium thermohalophilum]|uniref:prephenate dehydratase n=1 Tax=Dichotomicrobium thermohalophilum TaxID=933063 RepID=A0A397Q2L3_9HYPH|nr:prephenate dehydratase [Dichotomicrobium thermohalophilum]RIA55298.1 prephenate dehydratase [Dichotomicrobium thermohalophilum]